MPPVAVVRCSDIVFIRSFSGRTIADPDLGRYCRRRDDRPRPMAANGRRGMVLKAELHCHIEEAAAPELVIQQARRYNMSIEPFIRDGSFVWHDFTSFLKAYDFAADLFRSEDDYARLAEHYL